MVFTGASVARAFFITAGAFAGLSIYGYTTKRDLTAMGGFLIVGVFGLILASIVNIFCPVFGDGISDFYCRGAAICRSDCL